MGRHNSENFIEYLFFNEEGNINIINEDPMEPPIDKRALLNNRRADVISKGKEIISSMEEKVYKDFLNRYVNHTKYMIRNLKRDIKDIS